MELKLNLKLRTVTIPFLNILLYFEKKILSSLSNSSPDVIVEILSVRILPEVFSI